MLTAIIFFSVIVLCLLFFIFYKRDMLARLLSLNTSVPAKELEEQLERTADMVIKQLENHIGHLELLLEEADGKMALLDQKLALAERVIDHQETTPYIPATISRGIDIRLPAEAPADYPSSASSANKNGAAKDGVIGGRHRLVLTMSEQGYSVTEIAKATGMGKGEIMLLLQLNKK